MLSIRVSKEKDRNKILELLTEEGFENVNLDDEILHNSMVVSDGGQIIGYSNYIEIPNEPIAVIERLIVKKEYRRNNIGDGLIKSLLNLADRRKIKKVYMSVRNKDSMFLKKVGLTKRKLKDSENIMKYLGNEMQDRDSIEVFEAILPDFFNKACKSKI